MAESKGALIAKSVQKHAGRAKEKLLQNLGKVDRTLDDIFEEHLQNFNRQHQQATRLQKEFNNYIRCIRAVQTASKSLMEAITEVYESGWSGHDLLYVQAQSMEMLWQDFSHKLGDQVLIPLNTYTNQFPEVRKKIEKRGRKLVDYDSQRHSFQNLQANAAKRRDDVKVTRGREQLEEAKRTYEVLNSELHDELPALYDSRVLFYVNNLQTLFAAEQLFHSESSKVFSELEAITDKLATDCQRGSYSKRALTNSLPSPSSNTNTLNGNSSPTNTVQTPPATPARVNGAPPSPPTPPTAPQRSPPSTPPTNGDGTANSDQENSNGEAVNNKEKTDKKVEELYDIPVGSPVVAEANSVEKKSEDAIEETPQERAVDVVDSKEKPKEPKQDEVYDIPVGATLAGLPPGTLYRVRATYRYTREDADELSFDVGDVIRVVEYDDPEEQPSTAEQRPPLIPSGNDPLQPAYTGSQLYYQVMKVLSPSRRQSSHTALSKQEEGWLMGIKESTNEKGMFPANFTRPI